MTPLRERMLGFLAVLALLAAAVPVTAQPVARASFSGEFTFAAGPSGPRTPLAIGVAPDGNVHLVDRNGGVFVFAPEGGFVRSYGDDQLERPVAVDFDDRGWAYVLDRDPARIQVFRAGEFDWGYTISGGGRNGPARLREPVDLAVGPNGYVHVLDRGEQRILVFGRDGALIRQLQLPSTLRNPVALHVDGDGTIAVVSESSSNLMLLLPPFFETGWNSMPSTEPLQIGAQGELVAVAFDGHGTVVALDGDEGRLWGGSRLSGEAAQWSRQIYGGAGSTRGSFREAVDTDFGISGELFVLDAELRKVERVALAQSEARPELDPGLPIRVSLLPADVQGAVLDVGMAGDDELLLGLAADEGRRVSVVAAAGQRFRDYFDEPFVEFRPEPGGPVRLALPRLSDEIADLAFNDTLVVIVEPDEDRFRVFDLRDGTQVGSFGSDFEDDRRLRDPVSAALFPNGAVAVADQGNDRVVIFSADLASLIDEIPVLDVAGVEVSPDGRSLFVWNESGVLSRIDVDSRATEQILGVFPGSVADVDFDPVGNLFVLQKETSRVSVVTADLARVMIRFGGRDENLEATHVSVDPAGNVYLSSMDRDTTHVYRWDVRLPAPAESQITLTPGGGVLRWAADPTEYRAGFRVKGSADAGGPYRTLLETTELEAVFEAPEDVRYVRVVAFSAAGSESDPSPWRRLHHLQLLEADQDRVAGHWDLLVADEEQGGYAVDAELRPELVARVIDANVELGYFEDAVSLVDDVSGWTGTDGGYRVNRQLARAHGALEQDEPTLARVDAALAVISADARRSEEGKELLDLGLTAAFRLELFPRVEELAEELLPMADAEDEYEVAMRLATARLEGGDPRDALDIAADLRARELSGELRPFGTDRYRLALTAVRAGVRLNDVEAVESWLPTVEAGLVPEDRLQFYAAVGTFRLRQGDAEGALASLEALQTTAEGQDLSDPVLVAFSFQVYDGLRRIDMIGAETAALGFFEDYIGRLPADDAELRQQYVDSLTVFRGRAETRRVLSPVFEAYRGGDSFGVAEAGEPLLSGGNLTLEQEILVRALLAESYLQLGRDTDAEDAVRILLQLAPALDPPTFNIESRALWDFTAFPLEVMTLVDRIRSMGISKG